MPLTKPALAPVSPGQPVTAQAWNAIVGGLGDLYDAVLAFGTATLDVRVLDAEDPIADATVVAEPLGPGQPVAALPPRGNQPGYTIAGLTPGSWRLFVSAPGYLPQTVDAKVPAAGPVVVSLKLAGVLVPDVFGMPGQQALAVLGAAKLTVGEILDTLGQPVAHSLGGRYQNQPILTQLPEAGAVVDPLTTMRLVIAAAIERTPMVKMPNLVGLSMDEAGQALSSVGLALGNTTTRGAETSQIS